MLDGKSMLIGVVVLVVLILTYYYDKHYAAETNIMGCWRADPEFLASSQLLMMMFTISEYEYWGGKGSIFLLAENASGLIMNQMMEFRLSLINTSDAFNKVKKYQIILSNDDEWSWFPNQQIIEYNTEKHRMIWFDGEDCKAILYKDNCLSDFGDESISNLEKSASSKNSSEDEVD